MNSDLLLHQRTAIACDQYRATPSQATLLTGKKGIGKTLLARQLAASLLKTVPEQTDQHAYCKIIVPVDGAIPIAAIREIQQFVSLKVPSNSQINRVIILQDADMMTREAQNALLKLLEEPPLGTVYILTSSRPAQLLPTILSRVQRLLVLAPEAADVATYFVAQGFSTAEVTRAQALAGDDISALRAVLSGEMSSEKLPVDIVKRALSSPVFERLTLVDGVLKDKAAAREFVQTLLKITAAGLSQSVQSTDGAKVQRWEKVQRAALVAEDSLAKNANTKLVLDELLLSL